MYIYMTARTSTLHYIYTYTYNYASVCVCVLSGALETQSIANVMV